MGTTPLDDAMTKVEAAALPPADAPAAPRTRPSVPSLPPLSAALSYDGDNRELMALWLRTLGLTFLTLGFYRFWGRTRIRQYLWSRLALIDDRFEYDGTGMELFVRFVLVVFIVLVPLAGVRIGVEFSGWSEAGIVAVQYLEILVIFFLSLVGHYTGQRYRLSRSLWRGLRGGLDGSALNYAFRALGFSVLQSLTLGLTRPWQLVHLWRYEADNTRLGSQHLSFKGNGADLFQTWFKAVLLGSLAFIAAFIVVVAAVAAIAIALASLYVGLHPGEDPKQNFPVHLVAAIVAGSVVSYLIFIAVAWLLWLAITGRFERDWLAYSAAGTLLGELRFAVAAEVREVRRLRIGNFLITIATLGLGWPFVAHRTLRFYARTVRLDATGLDRLSQTEPPSRPPASGIAELFDTTGFA